MNIDWYRTFIVLTKHLNYRKASEELFVSPPSVFSQIKNIENELGIKLFEKKGRNINLTQDGKQFLPVAESALEAFDSSIYFMDRLVNEKKPLIKLCASEYVADYILSETISEFLKQHPNIDISISVINEEYMSHSLLSGRYDVAIGQTNFSSEKITSLIIGESETKLIVPIPEVINQEIMEDELHYLKSFPVVIENTTFYNELLKSQLVKLVPMANFKTIDSVKIIKKLIESKQAISYLPLNVLEDKDHLKMKVVDSKLIVPPMSKLYISHTKATTIITTFIEFLFRSFSSESSFTFFY